MPIGIRPNTLRKLKQKQVARISPLHISIARLSYLKDQQQSAETMEDEQPFYRIIKRGKK